MTNTYSKPSHRFGLIFGLFAAVTLLFTGVSQARTYERTVTIYDYYGYKGKNEKGQKIYGASVIHGDHFYFVELLNPMPCLIDHRNERATVTLSKTRACWTDVYFDGHVGKIHRVTKVEDQQPTYDDFYHETSNHETTGHDHDHHRNDKVLRPWLPFSRAIFGSN